MKGSTITRHACPGLRPVPLASYLAGLGLIRVLGDTTKAAAAAATVLIRLSTLWFAVVLGLIGLAVESRASRAQPVSRSSMR